MSEQLDLEDWLRENPKSLTEQWKKGELGKDKYWVKYRNGKIDIWELSDGIPIESRPEIIEVLAPVPSYEKHQELEKEHNLLGELCERLLCIEEKQWESIVKTKTKEQQIDFLSHKTKFSFLALFDENQQLKELLKKCREEFICINNGGAYWSGDFDEILEKLDNSI